MTDGATVPKSHQPWWRQWGWKGLLVLTAAAGGIVGLLFGLVVGIAAAGAGVDSQATPGERETVTRTATERVTETVTEQVTPVATETVTAPPPPPAATITSPGTYVVGTDIEPGVYRHPGSSEFCQARRMSSPNELTGGATVEGQTFVEVLPEDWGVRFDCGGWARQG